MPLTTPQALINLALKSAGILGVGQSALAEDNNDCFDLLNGMLAAWCVKRWFIFQEQDLSVSVTGAKTYSIGPGGDINTTRVDRLEAAYFRQFPQTSPNTGPIDFPLTVIKSMEDYSTIALKDLTTWPVGIFLNSGYPMGTLYPVPIPTILPSELHVIVKAHIPQFDSLVQSINLPDEYTEALWTNLAVRLGAIYPGSSVPPITVGLAKASLSTIRMANTQVPTMSMPSGMSRPPLFNIYSGQVYAPCFD